MGTALVKSVNQALLCLVLCLGLSWNTIASSFSSRFAMAGSKDTQSGSLKLLSLKEPLVSGEHFVREDIKCCGWLFFCFLGPSWDSKWGSLTWEAPSMFCACDLVSGQFIKVLLGKYTRRFCFCCGQWSKQPFLSLGQLDQRTVWRSGAINVDWIG